MYTKSESAKLDKIISRIHGKKAKAGRVVWESLAKARHHRKGGENEPALDIFDEYLKRSPKLKANKAKDRWEGSFPFTVLDEAVKKLAPFFDKDSSNSLAKAYKKGLTDKEAETIDRVIFEIADKDMKTRDFRTDDWHEDYGLTKKATPDTKNSKKGTAKKKHAAKKKAAAKSSVSSDDPNIIKQLMKDLSITMPGCHKLEALRVEATHMTVPKMRHAFCFLLRSMFEISAKSYCDRHKKDGMSFKYTMDAKPTAGGKIKYKKGDNKTLRLVMKEVVDHLADLVPGKKGILKKALGILDKADNPLSIDSLNHLIHNERYSVDFGEMRTHFFNVYPLLEQMNDN